jgi:hypothetical protein
LRSKCQGFLENFVYSSIYFDVSLRLPISVAWSSYSEVSKRGSLFIYQSGGILPRNTYQYLTRN